MKKTLLHTFLLVIILASCKDNTVTIKYPSGQVEEVYETKGEDLKHGKYTAYHENGTVREECTYVEGKLEGERTIFNKEGKIEIKEIYKDNILNGPYTTYHANGKVKLEGEYVDNVLKGIVKGYYPSGSLKEEVTFENSREDGPFKEYHENGKIKWEGTYRMGNNEFGLLQKYNEEGVLIQKMMCDDKAICTTTWTIDGSHLKNKKG